jgi:hypothetical protein
MTGIKTIVTFFTTKIITSNIWRRILAVIVGLVEQVFVMHLTRHKPEVACHFKLSKLEAVAL